MDFVWYYRVIANDRKKRIVTVFVIINKEKCQQTLVSIFT